MLKHCESRRYDKSLPLGRMDWTIAKMFGYADFFPAAFSLAVTKPPAYRHEAWENFLKFNYKPQVHILGKTSLSVFCQGFVFGGIFLSENYSVENVILLPQNIF